MASDRLRREIESLLRWPMRGGIASHLRGPVLGMRSSAVGESGYPPWHGSTYLPATFWGIPYSQEAPAGWGEPLDTPPGTAGGEHPQRTWNSSGSSWSMQNQTDWESVYPDGYFAGNVWWRGVACTLSWDFIPTGGGAGSNVSKYCHSWIDFCLELGKQQYAKRTRLGSVYCNGKIVKTLPLRPAAGVYPQAVIGAAILGDQMVVVALDVYNYGRYGQTGTTQNFTLVYRCPVSIDEDGNVASTGTWVVVNSGLGEFKWTQQFCFSQDGSTASSIVSNTTGDNSATVKIARLSLSGAPLTASIAYSADYRSANSLNQLWWGETARTNETACTGGTTGTTGSSAFIQVLGTLQNMEFCPELGQTFRVYTPIMTGGYDYVTAYEKNFESTWTFEPPGYPSYPTKLLAVDYKENDEQIATIVYSTTGPATLNIRSFTYDHSWSIGGGSCEDPHPVDESDDCPDSDEAWAVDGTFTEDEGQYLKNGYDILYDFDFKAVLKVNDVEVLTLLDIDEHFGGELLTRFRHTQRLYTHIMVPKYHYDRWNPSIICDGQVTTEEPFWIEQGFTFTCATLSPFRTHTLTEMSAVTSSEAGVQPMEILRKVRKLLHLDLTSGDVLFYEAEGYLEKSGFSIANYTIYNPDNDKVKIAVSPEVDERGRLALIDSEGIEPFEELSPEDFVPALLLHCPARETISSPLSFLAKPLDVLLALNKDNQNSGVVTNGGGGRMVAARYPHVTPLAVKAEKVALFGPDGDPLDLASATGTNQFVGGIGLVG